MIIKIFQSRINWIDLGVLYPVFRIYRFLSPPLPLPWSMSPSAVIRTIQHPNWPSCFCSCPLQSDLVNKTDLSLPCFESSHVLPPHLESVITMAHRDPCDWNSVPSPQGLHSHEGPSYRVSHCTPTRSLLSSPTGLLVGPGNDQDSAFVVPSCLECSFPRWSMAYPLPSSRFPLSHLFREDFLSSHLALQPSPPSPGLPIFLFLPSTYPQPTHQNFAYILLSITCLALPTRQGLGSALLTELSPSGTQEMLERGNCE